MADTPAIPVHFTGEHEDNGHNVRGDENRPDCENEQLSPRSFTPSMIEYLFASFFVPGGAKITSVDSGLQTSPSETTPLLASPTTYIEEPVDHGSNAFLSVLWQEVKTLVRYALPVFGTHVFEHSIFMSSVIAIGHISTRDGQCLDTVLPSAWTSGQPNIVGLWTQRMAVLQFLVLIVSSCASYRYHSSQYRQPIYVMWFNGEALLLALRQDPEVARYAGIYLKWASLSLPAYSFNCISRRRYFVCLCACVVCSAHHQGLFDVPARIIVFVAPINILLSYLLVWGPDSMRLGFIGAPIATSISYNLISIASVIYGVFFVERTAWHPISSRCLTSLGSLARLCMGSIGQVASEWWSWELVGRAIFCSLGPIPLATQSVLISTVSCTFQAPFAVGIATSVRIGNLLGEKDANRAGVAANAAILLSIFIALFLSGVLLTFRATWGYMFNSDPAVVTLVAAVLPLVALVQIFDDCGAVISGILRARGKQTLGALINISAYYCLGFPIGLWLTFKQHWGLFGLWWGLTIAMTWVVLLGTCLCVTADWQKEVEKVMVRLAVDKAYQRERRDEEYVHAHQGDQS
ncbi:MATE efflux family protein [Lanmaoa asiatica]|nr:MATE efflux family protein [Lanmaoa asiatica]